MSGLKPARGRIWAALRDRATTGANLRELIDVTGVDSETIAHYLRCLVAGGFVAVDKRRPFNYRLINDVGVDAPRVMRDGSLNVAGQMQANMWRTMRILPTFDFYTLAAHATTSAVEILPATAKGYVNNLRRAGYLTLIKPSGMGRGAKACVYALTKNTGAKPPMVQRLHVIFDQNLNKIMYQEEAGNE